MSNDSDKDFPWYCSYGGPIGVAACPRKDLPWYCYMGGLGRKKCVDEGLIPDDLITKLIGDVEDVADGALWAAKNLHTILIGAAVIGGGVGLLWAAKTFKDISR